MAKSMTERGTEKRRKIQNYRSNGQLNNQSSGEYFRTLKWGTVVGINAMPTKMASFTDYMNYISCYT